MDGTGATSIKVCMGEAKEDEVIGGDGVEVEETLEEVIGGGTGATSTVLWMVASVAVKYSSVLSAAAEEAGDDSGP